VTNPSPERLEANYRNLDRAIGWIASADAKATTILTVNGVLLGFVVSRLSDVIASNAKNVAYVPWAQGSYVVTAALLLVSLWQAVIVFYPIVRPPTDSIFFFESIAGMSKEKFGTDMRGLDAAKIEDELIAQTRTVATIVAEKLDHVRCAIWFLLIGLLVLLAHYFFWAKATT
jgi:hypothetical protein